MRNPYGIQILDTSTLSRVNRAKIHKIVSQSLGAYVVIIDKKQLTKRAASKAFHNISKRLGCGSTVYHPDATIVISIANDTYARLATAVNDALTERP